MAPTTIDAFVIKEIWRGREEKDAYRKCTQEWRRRSRPSGKAFNGDTPAEWDVATSSEGAPCCRLDFFFTKGLSEVLVAKRYNQVMEVTVCNNLICYPG